METLFASPTLAAGYARSRPPVHSRLVERISKYLAFSGRMDCAVDIGCGAGLSTGPLTAVANLAIGIEPLVPMLKWTRETAPGAVFVAARAESIPLADSTVDLITAAGSLNYADLDAFFPEARRLLRPGGTLAVYDFSQGRRMTGTAALESWFDEFQRRYPSPPFSGRALDPEILSRLAAGFHPTASLRFSEPLMLTRDFYVNYAMTETNVAAAVRAGVSEDEIRYWCAESLEPIFSGQPREIWFDGYIACFDTLSA